MSDALKVASLYRLLPSVDKLLQSPDLEETLSRYGRTAAVVSGRTALSRIRTEISLGNADEIGVRRLVDELPATIVADITRTRQFSLRRVINATGVILHTNLGRAPLSRSAIEHISEVAGDYSNLELDLETGR